MVGNNTPVFFLRDGLKFGDFILTQKEDPATNLKSPTMMWDFWSLSQRAAARTNRPQRDTARAFGPKPLQPPPPGS